MILCTCVCVCAHLSVDIDESWSQMETRGPESSLPLWLGLMWENSTDKHKKRLRGESTDVRHWHDLMSELWFLSRLCPPCTDKCFFHLTPNVASDLRLCRTFLNKAFWLFALTCACAPGWRRPWRRRTGHSAARNGGNTCREMGTIRHIMFEFWDMFS